MKEKKNSQCTDALAHHWIIKRPKGLYSRGVCKHCGEVKLFQNGLNEEGFRKFHINKPQ